MKLRVTQNSIGRYNLLSNENSLSFSMVIVDNDGKVIDIDGHQARLHYSGNPEYSSYFEDPVENIHAVFDMCYRYADRVWGSTDYKKQCLTFAKVYRDNYDVINKNHVDQCKNNINKQIKTLQDELEKKHDLGNIDYETNSCIEKDISKYSNWIKSSEEKMSQYKKNSEGYKEEKDRVDGYKNKIEELNKYLISV